jgi:hypothetical protein
LGGGEGGRRRRRRRNGEAVWSRERVDMKRG